MAIAKLAAEKKKVSSPIATPHASSKARTYNTHTIKSLLASQVREAKKRAQKNVIEDGKLMNYTVLVRRGGELIQTVSQLGIEVTLSSSEIPQMRVRALAKHPKLAENVRKEHVFQFTAMKPKIPQVRHLVIGMNRPVIVHSRKDAVILDRHPDARTELVDKERTRERATIKRLVRQEGFEQLQSTLERLSPEFIGLKRLLDSLGIAAERLSAAFRKLEGDGSFVSNEAIETIREMAPALRIFMHARGELAAINERTGGSATDVLAVVRHAIHGTAPRS